jgi:hypothetical protein
MRSLWAVLVLTVAACGGGGGSGTTDGGGGGDDDGGGGSDSAPIPDAPVDAAPPNTAHRGLAQATRIGAATSATVSIGFYDTPSDAPGCTWTYIGSCSLEACETDAGLVAASAGAVTYTADATPSTYTPTGATYMTAGLANVGEGSSITISAEGDTVPAFTTAALTMPAPLEVSAPVDNGTIDRTQPLTAAWTPVAGNVYFNISQQFNDGPYPSSYARTIRCEVDAQDGTVDVPTSLLAGLAPGSVNVSVCASATDIVEAGAYEVTGRLLAVDGTRQMTVE